MGSLSHAEGVLELHWGTDLRGHVLYVLYAREKHGQLVLLSSFEQGPFDTAVEVSQWVVRVIAREVPPAST